MKYRTQLSTSGCYLGCSLPPISPIARTSPAPILFQWCRSLNHFFVRLFCLRVCAPVVSHHIHNADKISSKKQLQSIPFSSPSSAPYSSSLTISPSLNRLPFYFAFHMEIQLSEIIRFICYSFQAKRASISSQMALFLLHLYLSIRDRFIWDLLQRLSHSRTQCSEWFKYHFLSFNPHWYSHTMAADNDHHQHHHRSFVCPSLCHSVWRRCSIQSLSLWHLEISAYDTHTAQIWASIDRKWIQSTLYLLYETFTHILLKLLKQLKNCSE